MAVRLPTSRRRPSPPGADREMSPTPDHGETSYRGLGRLAGRTALITGADSGIGRAVAIAFAREGADVLVSHLPQEERDGADTVRWVEDAGRRAVRAPGDLCDEGYCTSLVDWPLPSSAGSTSWSTTPPSSAPTSPSTRSPLPTSTRRSGPTSTRCSGCAAPPCRGCRPAGRSSTPRRSRPTIPARSCSSMRRPRAPSSTSPRASRSSRCDRACASTPSLRGPCGRRSSLDDGPGEGAPVRQANRVRTAPRSRRTGPPLRLPRVERGPLRHRRGLRRDWRADRRSEAGCGQRPIRRLSSCPSRTRRRSRPRPASGAHPPPDQGKTPCESSGRNTTSLAQVHRVTRVNVSVHSRRCGLDLRWFEALLRHRHRAPAAGGLRAGAAPATVPARVWRADGPRPRRFASRAGKAAAHDGPPGQAGQIRTCSPPPPSRTPRLVKCPGVAARPRTPPIHRRRSAPRRVNHHAAVMPATTTPSWTSVYIPKRSCCPALGSSMRTFAVRVSAETCGRCS